MNSNGLLKKHWFQVSLHFLLDAGLFIACFYFASWVRFRGDADDVVSKYWPGMVVSAATFASTIYIAGLYTSHSLNRSGYRRFFLLGCCIIFAALTLIGSTYVATARPLGRGYMALSTGSLLFCALAHHAYLLYALKTARERVAYIVTSAFDEGETHIFSDIGLKHLDFAGVISGLGYQPSTRHRQLGSMADLAEIVERERIDRVLVTSKSLGNVALSRQFCVLRYSGVTVTPLVLLCEEVDQYVPLELISPEWLLNASGEPHLLYIRKVKRLFDIVASLAFLIISLPFLLLGMLAVKLTSPGPIFYRQTRSGRFGRPFSMIKLRTMRTDAEKGGVQWASGGTSGDRDPRVTAAGGFLRRFRIDEIPQLWNVLRGDMSFVGPRPERPEFITQLAAQIPFYEERMMVQPGITGWAQVNYPYGASVLDARRKLEYDLYYLKNMGVFLDIFILLDTIRAVLFGASRGRYRRVIPDALSRISELRKAEKSPAELELGAV